MAKYIIRKDSQKNYYWLLLSTRNYKFVARSSESYESKQGAKDSIAWTQVNGPSDQVDDDTGE